MRKEAVSTFNKGLTYDLNPIVTPNNVLTDAVNGTFITFNGDELVLDVGCGDGKITVELANLVPRGRVLGTDFSADMISHAKLTHNVSNLEFQQLDAEDITSEG